MEIIKKGNLKCFSTTCVYCESVLKFTKRDIKFKMGGFMGLKEIPYLICPNCDNALAIPDSELKYFGWERV